MSVHRAEPVEGTAAQRARLEARQRAEELTSIVHNPPSSPFPGAVLGALHVHDLCCLRSPLAVLEAAVGGGTKSTPDTRTPPALPLLAV